MEPQRSGGMTAIAALTVIVGGLQILAGLFQLLVVIVLMLELNRQGVFQVPVARLTFALGVLVTGVVGLIAGVGLWRLRPPARTLSLVFAGLLIVSAVSSCFSIPIIASLGSYDIRAVNADGLTRLVIFCGIYVVVPVFYSAVVCTALGAAWKNSFAKGADRSAVR